jgi:tetratricopeptide (TPR) repeat protein
MRFIKGGTLGQATRAYHKDRAAGTADPLGLVKLLGAFIGVCHAVGYAHSRGIIHRDLKGQNVVLGDFGEVIVLDWGLAKRIGPVRDAGDAGLDGLISGGISLNGASASGVSAEDDDQTLPPETAPQPASAPRSRPRVESGAGPEGTMHGQLLGTPAYMAPEQAEGWQHETDERTDVYGLGAILYEVLTGQPPFHAKTTHEMLRKVRKEAPLPPRQVNPSVSPALEAVCLKALSKPPVDRYTSATELAREVQRYLADEPVLAYSEPWTRRAARWARKHRTAVAAAAGLLVTSTVALSVGTVLIGRERNEAVAQRNEARVQGQQARQTVNDMYTGVAEGWLEDRLDPKQKEFMEKALAYYQDYTSQAASDPAVKLEHGRIYQRMGDIHAKFGQQREAERAYDRAIALIAPLAQAAPRDAEAARAQAVAWTRLGNLLFRQDRTDEAGHLYAQAEDLLRPLAAAADAPVQDTWLLARTLRDKAELLRRKGQIEAARGANVASLELLQKAHAADPKEPEIRCDLATANDVLSRLHREFGETDARRQAARRAYELIDGLVAEYPTVPRYREALYNACNSAGGLEYETGHWPEAEVYWRREYREAERLSQDYPDRPDYKHHLAGGNANLGGILTELDKLAEAEPILRRGIELCAEVVDKMPDDREMRFDLGKCHHNLGYLLLKQGKVVAAIASLEKAREVNGFLAEKFPDVPRYRQIQASYLRRLGDALDAVGRPGVEKTYQEALGISEKLVAQYPTNALFRLELARCLNSMGTLLAKAGRGEEADRTYQRALAALEAKDVPAWTEERQREKAFALSNLGELRRSLGKPDDAESPLREAVAIAQGLAGRSPAASEDRRFLSQAQENLAEVLENRNHNDQAAALFDESIARIEDLIKGSPRSIVDQYLLGYFSEQKGKLLAKLGKPAEAKIAFEGAVAHQREAVRLTDGKVPTYRATLVGHLEGLANACLALAQYDEVSRAAQEMARAAPEPAAATRFAAAKLFARSATLVREDTRLDPARRQKLLRGSLGSTVVMLREAIEGDPKLAAALESEPVFKKLRDQPEFENMLNSLVDTGRQAKQ